jgi:Zinc finger C-x8-C-x5-C-x3-H type (and similar)
LGPFGTHKRTFAFCLATKKGCAAAAGILCRNAHGAHELRVSAAIEEGLLPPEFKLMFCESFFDRGRCKNGDKCHFAHSIKELR